MYYTGIYSFYHHLSEMASVEDVMSAKYGTAGVNMFAFGQASAPSVDALGKGPWREKAVNPGEEPIEAVYAVLKDMQQEINHIYIPKGALARKEGNDIRQALQDIQKSVRKNPEKSTEAFQKAETKIQDSIKSGKLASTVGERMKSQLADTKQWVNYFLDRQN